MLPSSQASEPVVAPSPQKAVLPGAELQLLLQTVQELAPYGQLSVTVLPSSQPSVPVVAPSPQKAVAPATDAQEALQMVHSVAP